MWGSIIIYCNLNIKITSYHKNWSKGASLFFSLPVNFTLSDINKTWTWAINSSFWSKHPNIKNLWDLEGLCNFLCLLSICKKNWDNTVFLSNRKRNFIVASLSVLINILKIGNYARKAHWLSFLWGRDGHGHASASK